MNLKPSFGFVSPAANFRRLGQKVLDELGPSRYLIYLDDISSHETIPGGHNEQLEEVLQRSGYARLLFSFRGYRFLQRRATFVGYIITPDGMQTDSSEAEKIQSWRNLALANQTRNFMGLRSHHRRFLYSF